MLIGVAVWILAAGLGRIAGISGITASALFAARERGWRFAFLSGLVLGGAALTTLFKLNAPPAAPVFVLVAAGLLVGFGTVLGGGCTSGHGVCGLARLSLRSLVAVITFMAVGAVTAALTRTAQGG
jgi:uncharacterized protein